MVRRILLFKSMCHRMKRWWKFGIGNTHSSTVIIATIITHLNSISVGMCQGYSAILLPQLTNDQLIQIFGSSSSFSSSLQFSITAEQASWIASLGVLTNPIGALLSGILMDVCGRKLTIMYTTIPFMFGWAIIALSDDINTLYAGRCITGLAIGMASSCYVYVAEISLPGSRGLLSSFGPVFVSLGVLLVYSFGYLFSWKIIASIGCLLAAISLAVIQYIPETASWLASNDRIAEAADSLRWFYDRNPSVVDRQLVDIVQMTKISRSSSVNDDDDDKSNDCRQLWNRCVKPEVWKPFVILLIFFSLQELTGLYVVLYYAVDFLNAAGTNDNNKLVASIFVGLLRFLVCIIGSLCIQRFNRKTVACSSALLMSVTMACAAVYEYRYNNSNDDGLKNVMPYSWIPLVCILANVSASTFGMLQIPWLMIGELFPLSVRGLMGGLVSSIAYFFIFVTVKFYPTLLPILRMSGMMTIFSLSSLLAALYVCIFVPETKDKSLMEIEKGFCTSSATNNEDATLPDDIEFNRRRQCGSSVQNNCVRRISNANVNIAITTIGQS